MLSLSFGKLLNVFYRLFEQHRGRGEESKRERGGKEGEGGEKMDLGREREGERGRRR